MQQVRNRRPPPPDAVPQGLAAEPVRREQSFADAMAAQRAAAAQEQAARAAQPTLWDTLRLIPGAKVFPVAGIMNGRCTCGNPDCNTPDQHGKVRAGKHPFVAWREAATNDPAQIEAWMRQFPGCNWGLATGAASGVWVLDSDGDDGRASLERLNAILGELPPTLSQTTGRGEHHFFRTTGTPVRNSAGRLAGRRFTPPTRISDRLPQGQLAGLPVAGADRALSAPPLSGPGRHHSLRTACMGVAAAADHLPDAPGSPRKVTLVQSRPNRWRYLRRRSASLVESRLEREAL